MTSISSPPRSSPAMCPSSDTKFWSLLRDRVNGILESPAESKTDVSYSNRMKDDSLLLLKGFDCVTHSLSHISHSIDAALQGAKRIGKAQKGEESCEVENNSLKRRRGSELDENPQDEERETDNKLTKVKRTAIVVGKMAASLSHELKMLRSKLLEMEQRCVVLEEENRRFRKGESSTNTMIPTEEDDMMRLQMEVLLAEKFRLAGENANLVRENQCLHQIVEYHQMKSRSVDESYDEVVRGICLDFSSPPLSPGKKSADEVESKTCNSI